MPKAKTVARKPAGKPAGKTTGKTKSTEKSKKKKDLGAKLSKAFRNFAPIKELMGSSLGREVLADVLIAAAGAAAAVLTKGKSGSAEAAKDKVHTAAGAVAGVVTDAARHFLPASLLGDEEQAAQSGRTKPVGVVTTVAPKKRKAPVRRELSTRAPAVVKASES